MLNIFWFGFWWPGTIPCKSNNQNDQIDVSFTIFYLFILAL